MRAHATPTGKSISVSSSCTCRACERSCARGFRCSWGATKLFSPTAAPAPAALGVRTSRDVPLVKTINHHKFSLKKGAIVHRVFPVKKFVDPPHSVSYSYTVIYDFYRSKWALGSFSYAYTVIYDFYRSNRWSGEARGGSIKKNRLRRADVLGRPAGRPVKRFVRRPARLMGSERYVALPGGWRM